ncbi:uncharacterized protein LOC107826643 isoform X2 [Nicotiana tabacum]
MTIYNSWSYVTRGVALMVSNLHFQPRDCEFESLQEQGGEFLEGMMPRVYLETTSLPQGRGKLDGKRFSSKTAEDNQVFIQ